MKKYFLFVFMIAGTTVHAQKKSDPTTYANSITVNDLKKHLYVIAGKEMQGRETATEGQRRAAAYIENEFRNLGLLPGNNGSYQQFFPVYRDSLISSNLEVNGRSFEIDKDYNFSLSNNIASTFRFSEAVYIGGEAGDSVKNANLNGKLVIIQSDGGRHEFLQNKGVAAIISVGRNFPRPPLTSLGNMTVNVFRRNVSPQMFNVSEEVAKAILSDYDALKGDKKAYKILKANIALELNKGLKTLQSSNVLGLLEGGDLKDQYLVITAHYDHLGIRNDTTIYYGADDDGSGTVSIIELAEAFVKAKQAGKGPRRSILFMAVSGEEKGLWGSDYYTSHPAYPLAQTTANLNIDMIGRIDPKRTVGDSTNYVYVVGDDKLSSDLRPISESINKKYTKMELDYKYNAADDKEFIYYRSDHYNFAKNGVPIIFYFNGTHKDYHRPTDTPDKINYDLLRKRALFVFYTGWEMANRNEMLKRDLPLPELRR